MSRADLLLQWARHRDGELAPAAQAELLRGLEADPEARRLVLADHAIDGLLRCRIADPAGGERFTAGVAALLAAEADQGRFAARMRARVGRTQRLRRARRRRAWGALALAAALALALAGWVLLRPPPADLPQCDGRALAAGERIAADAPRELRWRDGSTARLEAGAVVAVGDPAAGKGLRLESGRVAVSAAHQPPGRPLAIATAHAVATVVGTEFTLAAADDAVRLEVSRGAVRLAGGGGELVVGAGGSGLADRFGVRAPGDPLFAWSMTAGPVPINGVRTVAPDGIPCLAAVPQRSDRVTAMAFTRPQGLFALAPAMAIAARVWIGSDVGWAGFYVQDYEHHRHGQWNLPLAHRDRWVEVRLPFTAMTPTNAPPARAGDPVHIFMLQAVPPTARLLLAEVRVEPPAGR